MKALFEEYGGVIITVAVIATLITIITVIMATNGTVQTMFTDLLTTMKNKVDAAGGNGGIAFVPPLSLR